MATSDPTLVLMQITVFAKYLKRILKISGSAVLWLVSMQRASPAPEGFQSLYNNLLVITNDRIFIVWFRAMPYTDVHLTDDSTVYAFNTKGRSDIWCLRYSVLTENLIWIWKIRNLCFGTLIKSILIFQMLWTLNELTIIEE